MEEWRGKGGLEGEKGGRERGITSEPASDGILLIFPHWLQLGQGQGQGQSQNQSVQISHMVVGSQ